MTLREEMEKELVDYREAVKHDFTITENAVRHRFLDKWCARLEAGIDATLEAGIDAARWRALCEMADEMPMRDIHLRVLQHGTGSEDLAETADAWIARKPPDA